MAITRARREQAERPREASPASDSAAMGSDDGRVKNIQHRQRLRSKRSSGGLRMAACLPKNIKITPTAFKHKFIYLSHLLIRFTIQGRPIGGRAIAYVNGPDAVESLHRQVIIFNKPPTANAVREAETGYRRATCAPSLVMRQFGGAVKKGQILSTRNRQTCVKRLMDASDARGILEDRTAWRSEVRQSF
ncbi:hypothetical protein EVAR_71510_1 [Eumeta japonica]|uniref:Uncharacterized protein n=1 Tax=Eumeta variegata TaxID=151549 RepID=A0A4C2A901_EUMVA|nr:hypothetical protein EVAR_71510_1 [Eumeta japonica]